MKPLIVTDLDNTLLDSAYSFEAARTALARIKAEGIPLVISSSKTRAEIEALRESLDNHDPFISENGGAVFIPKGYFPFPTEGHETDGYSAITLGRPYSEVREALTEARAVVRAGVKGFGDMTAGEVARSTGLTEDAARLAMAREFDEPFLFDGDERSRAELIRKLGEMGINCAAGGAFMHAYGTHDKGSAIRMLKRYYSRLYRDVKVIALGDSAIDAPLLAEADYPVLVKKPDGTYEDINLPGLIRAEGIGPQGWNRAVLGILDSIDASYRGYTC